MSVQIEEVQGILTFRLVDNYGPAEIACVLSALEKLENAEGPLPDRIMDLSAVETFETNFGDLSTVAVSRRVKTYRNSYRSAFVAAKPVQIGFARMYQTMAQNPSVLFTIVSTLEEAVAWLKAAPVSEDGTTGEVRQQKHAGFAVP